MSEPFSARLVVLGSQRIASRHVDLVCRLFVLRHSLCFVDLSTPPLVEPECGLRVCRTWRLVRGVALPGEFSCKRPRAHLVLGYYKQFSGDGCFFGFDFAWQLDRCNDLRRNSSFACFRQSVCGDLNHKAHRPLCWRSLRVCLRLCAACFVQAVDWDCWLCYVLAELLRLDGTLFRNNRRLLNRHDELWWWLQAYKLLFSDHLPRHSSTTSEQAQVSNECVVSTCHQAVEARPSEGFRQQSYGVAQDSSLSVS